MNNYKNLTKKLLLIPKRIKEKGPMWTLNQAKDYILYGSDLHANPTIPGIHIEVTSYCNLRCDGCSRTISVNAGSWKNKHMSIPDFQKLVDGLPTIGTVFLYGLGESSLHPDLPKLIRIAHTSKKFNKVALTLNLQSRNHNYYLDLFKQGLDYAYVSVDSLDPEIANKMRAGTKVEILKDRLKFLSSHLNKGGRQRITIRMVVGPENDGSFSYSLKELNRLGRFDVHIIFFMDWGGSYKAFSSEEKVSFTEKLPSLIEPLHNLVVDLEKTEDGPTPCSSPWNAPAIRVDGYLSCCPISWEKSYYNFQTIETPLIDYLNSGKLEEKWQKFKEGYPSFCTGCPSAHSIPGPSGGINITEPRS